MAVVAFIGMAGVATLALAKNTATSTRATANFPKPVKPILVKPAPKSAAPPLYEGIITQFNVGDGTFTIRTRDGSIITVKNPFAVGAFVSVNGMFDIRANIIPDVTQITFKNLSAADAIPIISEVNPGSGAIGTRVMLKGSGFTPKNNSVNFGGVRNAIPNIASPDGKTLMFVIPPRLCPDGIQKNCAAPILKRGNADYELSVSNVNGLSNATKFDLFDAPSLRIITTSLPQVIEQQQYTATLDALGGIESYSWTIALGSLPPGIKLISPVCIIAPCRVPAAIKGIPTVPGSYTFTVTLASGAETVSQEFTIVVVQALSSSY